MPIDRLPFWMAYGLTVTLIGELLLAAILKTRSLRDLGIVALSNLMTNPLVVSVSVGAGILFGKTGYFTALVLLEAGAVFAEGAVYRALIPEKNHPFYFSLSLNAASFALGFVLDRLLHLSAV